MVAPSVWRIAEYTEVSDIDRFSVEERRSHCLHIVGQYALDVAQGEGTLVFHDVGDASRSTLWPIVTSWGWYFSTPSIFRGSLRPILLNGIA